MKLAPVILIAANLVLASDWPRFRGSEFRLLGKNPLGEMCLATPAIAGGSLFIRTAEHLYRIGR